MIRDLHSFPTRRSSDLDAGLGIDDEGLEPASVFDGLAIGDGLEPPLRGDTAFATCSGCAGAEQRRHHEQRDRKSTRLNSSHLGISYAVFCLKKKNHNTQ